MELPNNTILTRANADNNIKKIIKKKKTSIFAFATTSSTRASFAENPKQKRILTN